MAKYVMNKTVKHGEGSKVYDLPEGSECPSELVKKMLALGHVDEYHEKAPTPAAKPTVRMASKAPQAGPDKDGEVEADKS